MEQKVEANFVCTRSFSIRLFIWWMEKMEFSKQQQKYRVIDAVSICDWKEHTNTQRANTQYVCW